MLSSSSFIDIIILYGFSLFVLSHAGWLIV